MPVPNFFNNHPISCFILRKKMRKKYLSQSFGDSCFICHVFKKKTKSEICPSHLLRQSSLRLFETKTLTFPHIFPTASPKNPYPLVLSSIKMTILATLVIQTLFLHHRHPYNRFHLLVMVTTMILHQIVRHLSLNEPFHLMSCMFYHHT